MSKDPTNIFILNSLKLPIIEDLYTLSNSTGISLKMIYLLSKNPGNFYTNHKIPKSDGTFRDIYSPNLSLKIIQRWILEEILCNIENSSEATAFKKGLNGPYENAAYHKDSLYFLQMDIKDFFPSITRKQVYYLFKNLGYNKFISNILANLSTLNNKLPQGGVCSPYLSNLICYKMDRRLKGLCSKRDILYTRYADDLTFSCNNKVALRKVKQVVEKIVINEGYLINHKKTRYSSPISPKKITGVTITSQKKLKADRQIKKKVRAMIHKAIVTGDYQHTNKILGYIAYINSIEKDYKEKIISYIEKLIDKQYKHFDKVVKAYNSNKFFRSLPDMTQVDINTQLADEKLKWELGIDVYDYYIFEEYKNMLEQRIDFMDKKGIFDQELKNEFERINDEVASSLEDEITPPKDDDIQF
ncbi:hypothetical protein GCM10007216_18650 [Thalassobacillus devorans]|uniref:RNA-directed DNA polymerase n=1 Tax=Thalassobacillus devorans TaxID=279813 RepID=A0ABQ1NZD9_9BACI|nr:retron St85 family RNA-directed DNA polymerase [Thalassobacillus devorans]NIK28192.1 retron-type reverse transcriptase [Thalassobacillus devorans]GGC88181.1 hypothetical protein GCM10007216_18650 [Thalassobacillus devorans]